MADEMYVSPDGGSRMRVATPETATRMRARGWQPEPAPEAKYNRGGTLPPGETTTVNTTGKSEPVRKPKSDES